MNVAGKGEVITALLLVSSAMGGVGCDKKAVTEPQLVPWAQTCVPPTLAGPFYEAHPEVFSRLSGFCTHVQGAERPDVGHRGAFGTGNGHVFGQVGLSDPVNSLHSLVGPTYERRDFFFGDYWILVDAEESASPTGFEKEWVLRSLDAPVVITRGQRGDLELDTVDFAPWTDGEARRCFLRILLLRNTGQTSSGPLAITVRSYNSTTTDDGSMLETNGQRELRTRFVDGEAVAGNKRLTLATGTVEAGQERRFELTHCASDPGDATALPSLDIDALLDETAGRYQAWDADLLQVSLPDPLVEDFIDGMKLTLKVQTAATGANCPMSEYTRIWQRDTIGPVRAWLQLGAHDDVAKLLDYLYGAIVLRGNLSNSYDADLDLSALPAPPDWDTLGTLHGREAAESPSYLVQEYGLFYRHTGDLTRADERFGLLRHCLFDQGFGPDRLLPFSGDETFRAAMNASFGLDLEHGHAEKSWSANSAFVWLGAAREYARLARELNRPTDAEAADTAAVEVEAGVLSHYLLDDGCFSPFVDRETMASWPAPFEDVALKVTWSGWLSGDDPVATDSLQCLLDQVGVEPGVVQSPMHPAYENLTLLDISIKDGIYTGMLPGLLLSSLTAAGHPDAGAAFAALRQNLSSSGNLNEYLLFDDHSGLTAIHDRVGVLGDYTAKFRPWEGGIVLDALLNYLIGFVPDAANKTISLRPHLPAGWPSMSFANLRVGDDRFDLTLERMGAGAIEVRVDSRASSAYDVDLRWDSAKADPRVTVDEEPSAPLQSFEHFGSHSVQTPPHPLLPTAQLVFSVHGN